MTFDNIVIAPKYESLRLSLLQTLCSFEQFGKILQKDRNTIRRGIVGDLDITIKSFKKPNLVQGLIYGFFRPSKAKRSYEYAHTLIEKNIGTAAPIAYVENYSGKRLTESFFVSLYVTHDFTIREVIDEKVGNKSAIYKEFMMFTHNLHENDVLHLDHSPGNTLINESDGNYTFSIIDINRMKFMQLDRGARLKNLARLTNSKKELMKLVECYAQVVNIDVSQSCEYVDRLLEKRLRLARIKTFLKRFLKKKKVSNV